MHVALYERDAVGGVRVSIVGLKCSGAHFFQPRHHGGEDLAQTEEI